MKFRFAIITNDLKVLFDGEEIPVELNRYFKNALYTPTSGDRVCFLYDEKTKVHILIGKVVK